MAGWLPTTLLGQLPVAERDVFVRAGQERAFRAKETLLRQGDQDDHVLLLLRGIVKITVHSKDGEDTLLGVRVEGETVGEMAALEGEERMATVESCREVRARKIERAQLEELMSTHPTICRHLARTMSARLRRSDFRRIDVNCCEPQQRLCRVLVDLVDDYGIDVLGAGLTQRELGSLAGLKKRSAEQQLRVLKKAGVIACRYRAIEVCDMAWLREIADGARIPH